MPDNVNSQGDSPIRELAEADLDAVLVRSLEGSEAFGRRLLDAAGFHDPDGATLLAARRSVSDSTGETDVEAVWSLRNGTKAVLLIEDKLSAAFQPNQAQRYGLRARRMESTSDRQLVARTVLVAPGAYLESANVQAEVFDCRISVETIVRWLEGDADRFADRQLLGEALERVQARVALGAKGLYPSVHEGLVDVLQERVSNITIRNNKTDWVFFDHPSRVTGTEIRYRIHEGVAEIAFTNYFKGDLQSVLRAVPERFDVAGSGSYTFVRSSDLRVSETGRSGTPSLVDLEAIVDALEDLAHWWGSHPNSSVSAE